MSLPWFQLYSKEKHYRNLNIFCKAIKMDCIKITISSSTCSQLSQVSDLMTNGILSSIYFLETLYWLFWFKNPTKVGHCH